MGGGLGRSEDLQGVAGMGAGGGACQVPVVDAHSVGEVALGALKEETEPILVFP